MAMAEPYDPVKRREQYLKTRELKGRDPASQPPESTTQSTAKVVSKSPAPKVAPTINKISAANQAKVQARVNTLQEKLSKLNKALKRLLIEAKVDKVAKDERASEKPKGSSKTDPDEKLTASEKRKKAKDAKERYEKEKEPEEPAKKTESVDDKIRKTRIQIEEIKAALTKALAEARKTTKH